MNAIETMRRIGRPVAYHPALARHVGGVNAAIFLCQMIYWDEKADNEALGIYKTSEEWESETGLSYKEQATARRKLRELGLLFETHKRLEHKVYYKLDKAAFDRLITGVSRDSEPADHEQPDNQFANGLGGSSRNDQTAFRGDPNGHSEDAPNGNPTISTKTTTETTTENISSGSPSEAAECQFQRFWTSYPNTSRRVAKAKCFAVWKNKKLDLVASVIIEHVQAMKLTRQWLDGYEPAPLTYLNQRRWEDGLPEKQEAASRHGARTPAKFDPSTHILNRHNQSQDYDAARTIDI